MREPTERELWFQTMVGQILYRNDNGCPCPVCAKLVTEGIFVENEQHASYLYDIENDYNREGTPLRYFDTIEERDTWVKNLQDGKENTSNG